MVKSAKFFFVFVYNVYKENMFTIKNLYIYTLLVCSFASNKRQNSWTDRDGL